MIGVRGARTDPGPLEVLLARVASHAMVAAPMSMFTMPVEQVLEARIFARPHGADRQLLVLQTTLSLTEDGALVVPIPVLPGMADDAVTFLDAAATSPSFFEELGAPAPAVPESGDVEASFVPSPSHFNRLDARYRLPDSVWDAFSNYHDHGFCVFKLKTKRRPSGFFGLFKSKVPAETQRVRSLAFTFPRRDANVLFFPTVHLLDGAIHPTAHFDHELYCQTDRAWEPLMDWPSAPAGAQPLTNPEARVYRKTLRGELPNRDTTLTYAKLRARTEVTDLFRIRMRASFEHVVDDGKMPIEPTVKRWMRVSEAERVRVRETLASELTPIFQEKRSAWGLAPFVHDGAWMSLEVSNERIEPQELHVCFGEPPSSSVLAEIRAAAQHALDCATLHTNRGASLAPPSR